MSQIKFTQKQYESNLTTIIGKDGIGTYSSEDFDYEDFQTMLGILMGKAIYEKDFVHQNMLMMAQNWLYENQKHIPEVEKKPFKIGDYVRVSTSVLNGYEKKEDGGYNRAGGKVLKIVDFCQNYFGFGPGAILDNGYLYFYDLLELVQNPNK